MKSRSFRIRIALLSMLLSGVVLSAFAVAAWAWVYQLGLDRIDQGITGQAARHLSRPQEISHWGDLEQALQILHGDQVACAPILQVTGVVGETLHQSGHWPGDFAAGDVPKPDYDTLGGPPPAPPPMGAGALPPPPPAPITEATFATARASDATWRLGAMANDRTALVIGVDMAPFLADMRRSAGALLIALPTALLLIGLGAWFISERALRPVETIADTAERVTARGLDQRIPDVEHDEEFRRLITVFNAMLDRLEASFGQATRFSADAAHELKTPLTILQGELETALQASPPGSDEQRHYSDLLDEVQRLTAIVRKLLLLSLADSGQLNVTRERVNLSTLVEGALEDAEALSPRLSVTGEIAPVATVMADPDLMRQVLSNLSSNAIKYNHEGGRVEFRLEEDGSSVRLSVSNTGDGIPPEDRRLIFDRFYRADRSRSTDGSGLGLSLAREIVRAHDGTLTLEDQGEDGLTTFTMVLPKAE